MKQRIYIVTSVIGGYFDEEFKDATRELFKRFENNEITSVCDFPINSLGEKPNSF